MNETREYSVILFEKNGSKKTVKVSLTVDRTVEDLLLKVLRVVEIPLTALPFLTLCRKRRPCTDAARSSYDLHYGLPFFERLDRAARSRYKFFLRINPCLLPVDLSLARRLLGPHCLALLVHQVFTDMPASPTEVQVHDPGFSRSSCAAVAGLAFLRSLEPPLREYTAEDAGDTNPFLRNSSAADQRLRSYCKAYHQHIYQRLALFRTCIGRRRNFVDALMRPVIDSNSDDLTLFYENIHRFDPRPHPLAILSTVWPDDTEFDGHAMLGQLEQLRWNSVSFELEVSFFKKFILHTTAKCRVMPEQMGFLARYLSLWNPDVRCSLRDKDLDITPRLLRFCLSYNVQLPMMRKTFCRTANLNVEYEIDTKVLRSRGKFGLILRGRQPHQAEGGGPLNYISEDLRVLLRDKDKVEPKDDRGERGPAGFLPCIFHDRKPAIDRLPVVYRCDEAVIEGQFSEVRKVKTKMNMELAYKKLKPGIQNFEAALKWRLSLETAFDFYRSAWRLHPILAIDTNPENGSPFAVSRWVDGRSLHDNLLDPKQQFLIRHLLQIATQLASALVFLDALRVKDAGVHPRNVLVMEFTENMMSVCLTEAGTLWFDTDKSTPWNEEPCGLTEDHTEFPSFLSLMKTIYLSLRYGNVATLTKEKKDLWRSLRAARCVFDLLAITRKMLKAAGPELQWPLVSRPSKAMPDVMSLSSTRGNIIRELSPNFEQDQTLHQLGTGHSSKVFLVTLSRFCGMKVAVKKLEVMSHIDIEQEANIHRLLDHRNVIRLLDWDKERRLIAMEYANRGSLLRFVQRKEPNLESQLRDFCLQICEGMNYLHAREPSIIHRDLACRNILLHGERELCVKITDFGLSRIPENGIYHWGQNSRTELPRYWLPPSDFNSGRITVKLDVWSFGVCLWEMFTFGECPRLYYRNEGKKLEEDRLPQSYKCKVIPNAIFEVMQKCWQEPKERPTFASLIDTFQTL